MIEDTVRQGPFATGPLSVWQFMNLGVVVPADITLPDLPELSDDDETPPALIERDGGVATIHFHGVARFRIDLANHSITAFGVDPETADYVIDHILNDHIAPRLMAELGALVLHASAVRFGDRLALFLGETGVGKSTLATSLHQAGYPLLGDDAAIVTPGPTGFLAQALYPSLRLYPEAIERLLGNIATTSPMADHSDKQHVHLASLPQSVAEPLQLAAIFFLSGDDEATSVAAAALESTMACIKLVEQSFTLDPRDKRCATRRISALSQLALAVPTYTLSYPHDFARLGEVHAVIHDIMNNRKLDMPVTHRGKLVQ